MVASWIMKPRNRRAAPGGGLVLSVLMLTAGGGCAKEPTPDHGLRAIRKVDPFVLTERSGREVSLGDLLGEIWVVHLFFSSCSTDCQEVTAVVQGLQEKLRPLAAVRTVSFTCDPGTDDPAALRRYADALGADPERWWFVTGERKALFDTIRFSFLLPSARNTQERARLLAGPLHSDRLALVDRRGVVRGYFNALAPAETDRLFEAIQRLLAEPAEGRTNPAPTTQP